MVLRTLFILLLLPGAQALATTVYRSMDERGVVSFSDTPPAEQVPVEVLEIDVQQPQLSEIDRQRLAEMRDSADRMAADRREREQHRAALRQQSYPAPAPYPAVGYSDYPNDGLISYSSSYRGYRRGYRGHRPGWRPNHPRPEHPVARPPMRPAHHRAQRIRNFSVNDYPASLVRQGYSPQVRRLLAR